ncbi:MAG: sigma-54 dependent transcriptional regulator [Bryobacterales bacterium]|nr:sigma-54 dependent transcriptional regulator [Bryobacterales bacterium]
MPEESTAAHVRHPARILIVDDEPAIVESLQAVLEAAGYATLAAGTARECTEVFARQPCDLVLLDLMLPDRSGLEVLTDIIAVRPGTPVLMLTAYGSIETAVEATRRGAANFLTKPWNNRQLLLEIEQQLARKRLETENARLRDELGQADSVNHLIGKSEAITSVLVMIHQVARTTSTVLVTGESGTGKELVARAIHKNSARAEASFLTVNSGTIPGEMLESSLFGHVKGAFPGAERDRQGCFETAAGGTIFLDEVGALSREIQAKLLHVIQEREIVPVGSNERRRVDVRIIAASNEDLQAAVAAGRFREDLYYRLNVIGIELPPLRERTDDIPVLIEEFLTQFCRRESNHFLGPDRRSTLRFAPEAQQILMSHSWPGNVRELRNVVERAVVLATQEELGTDVLPDSIRTAAGAAAPQASEQDIHSRRPGESLPEIVERFERQVLLGELERHGYSQTETAKALGVALSTLNQKLQRLGIDTKRRRESVSR